jgi:hypothetical protein
MGMRYMSERINERTMCNNTPLLHETGEEMPFDQDSDGYIMFIVAVGLGLFLLGLYLS